MPGAHYNKDNQKKAIYIKQETEGVHEGRKNLKSKQMVNRFLNNMKSELPGKIFSQEFGCNNSRFLENYKESNSVLKNTKSNGSGKTIDHKCESCGRHFKYKRNLQFHMAIVHEGQKSSLKNNQNDTDKHITAVRLDREDHKCELCGKLFTFKRNLESHMSFSHNDKCDFCGTLFPDELKLEEHILAVHEDKKCDACGITFFHQKYLDSHMEIHR